jgi:low affinity Fe/Cu permease
MSVADDQGPDDQTLLRYLLGPMTEDETERLDELSITDDACASRVNALEHDLVDAYVKGELYGDALDRFTVHYLSSPAAREKVRFAEALLAHQRRAPRTAPHRRVRAFARVVAQWGLAAAALLVVGVAGYLLLDNVRLRNQVRDARAAHAVLEERERQLQRQLSDQQSAGTATAAELARVRESLAALEARTANTQPAAGAAVLSFVLQPPTRGVGELPTLAIPPATTTVALRLMLESDDYPRYDVVIRDPATDRIVSRTDNLRTTGSAAATSLAVTLGAGLLKPQIYRAEVTGVPARGAPEAVGGYSFRVVPK